MRQTTLGTQRTYACTNQSDIPECTTLLDRTRSHAINSSLKEVSMRVCSTCKYVDRHTVLPDDRHRCKLSDVVYPKINDCCLVNRKNMGSYGAMKVLHDMQKWR